MNLTEAILAIFLGILAASIAIFFMPQRRQTTVTSDGSTVSQISFLFDDGVLVDATASGEELLAQSNASADTDTTIDHIAKHFRLPEGTLGTAGSKETQIIETGNGSDSRIILVTRTGSITRLDVHEKESDRTLQAEGDLSSLVDELRTLRLANEATPYPVWQVDDDGEVIWHNPSYAALYRRVFGREAQQDAPLFRFSQANAHTKETQRIPLTPPGTRKPIWYDVTRSGGESGAFFSATNANAIVHAEAAQRNFVQTLAKTFAHLPIGLAIFDDQRDLILFNPAIVDLTGLGADFLSARPNLFSFFDELRNSRLMPEPKNYNSWRQQIADLVVAASDGRYSETWTLDNGRTYRVNGRPHPDGAIAFLIEDISSEVFLTRRFRAELELSQSVLDSLDTAIAVFSGSGVLTVSNQAYRTLWKVDPDSTFAEVSVIDCMATWQERALPSPVWGEIRDFVLDFNDRAKWSAFARYDKTRSVLVEVIPLVSGATMVRFKETTDDYTDPPISPEIHPIVT